MVLRTFSGSVFATSRVAIAICFVFVVTIFGVEFRFGPSVHDFRVRFATWGFGFWLFSVFAYWSM